MKKVRRGVVLFKKEAVPGWGTESWEERNEEALLSHCSSNMADIDLILARLRAVEASRGPEWLHSQVAALIKDQASGYAEVGVPTRAKV